jgi:NSS family neurotransmitter:Na+ symporter
LLVGLPVMISEIMLGRRAKSDAVTALKNWHQPASLGG